MSKDEIIRITVALIVFVILVVVVIARYDGSVEYIRGILFGICVSIGIIMLYELLRKFLRM